MWNYIIISLIPNGPEFKKYIDHLDQKLNIICIQETWLKPQLNFVLQGYKIERRDRGVGNGGGGVATFIKNDIEYSVINETEEYKMVIIEIYAEKQIIRIINYYNPCSKLSKELEKVIGSGNHKLIWCGDFNAHSTLWGNGNDDYNK